VGLRHILVDLQSFKCCDARLRNELTVRNHVPGAQEPICVGQTGVRAGIVSISGYGLLKVRGCLFESFLRPLIPKVAALEIELVCLIRIRRRSKLRTRRDTFVALSKCELNFIGDLLGDLALKCQQTAQFAVILPRP